MGENKIVLCDPRISLDDQNQNYKIENEIISKGSLDELVLRLNKISFKGYSIYINFCEISKINERLVLMILVYL